MLFFDPRVAPDGASSCGTCHQPDRGFSSDRSATDHDTQTLVNIGFTRRFAERTTLEERMRFAVEQHIGQHVRRPDGQRQSLADVVGRLRDDSMYHALLVAAGTDGLTEAAFLAALTEFVARLVSCDSPFDAYLGGDAGALSNHAQKGLALFRGRAGCVDCHNGPQLSDGMHYRVCVSGKLDTRYRRTPTLREITRTGPYFHDGSAPSLEMALRGHGADCDSVAADRLSEPEVRALVAFLHSLDGTPVQYYPIHVPGRTRALADLQAQMDRIDLLMKRNLDAIQAVVEKLSNPALSQSDWANIADASLSITNIAQRLSHLFPPQHLHDLSEYYSHVDQLAVSARSLAEAARSQQFELAFSALTTLNNTCNACHTVYRPAVSMEEPGL